MMPQLLPNGHQIWITLIFLVLARGILIFNAKLKYLYGQNFFRMTSIYKNAIAAKRRLPEALFNRKDVPRVAKPGANFEFYHLDVALFVGMLIIVYRIVFG